jgi:hypothetical protein|tara:strand:+ start:247 stop:387 length:141 start_codon:yes stop_codon:yes gene_type:complete
MYSDLDELIEQMDGYGTVETSDGCTVEPDGKCPHGYESPLREMGLI